MGAQRRCPQFSEGFLKEVTNELSWEREQGGALQKKASERGLHFGTVAKINKYKIAH